MTSSPFSARVGISRREMKRKTSPHRQHLWEDLLILILALITVAAWVLLLLAMPERCPNFKCPRCPDVNVTVECPQPVVTAICPVPVVTVVCPQLPETGQWHY